MNISNFVFLCVGDTSVLFDSLGGVVGDSLRSKNFPAPVFGGSNLKITTKNINSVVERIKQEYNNKKIVVIDCTCTKLQHINNPEILKENYDVNIILKNYVNQNIDLNEGKVNIANINYECGDYNILCETFCIINNKIFSINFKDVLVLSNRIVNKIYEFFKI